MARFTLSELAAICGATLVGDPRREVVGAAPLREAGPDEVSFCVHPRYRAELAETRAAAVVVPPALRDARADLALLVSDEPAKAFTALALRLAGERPRPAPGVHASAVLEAGVELGEGAAVGAFCHVGAGARIGPGAVLHPHAVVGAGAVVGAASELHPGVVLYPGVRLGARCLVHAGAVLGADGFGFEPAAPGEPWTKVPQCGTVVVEDDVEIGANVTVDRARLGATRLARGTKLDNLVHVGHNVELGRNAMLAAQVGIAGSTRVGDDVQLGGQVGISGHLRVGAGARVAAGSGVIGDVPPGEEWFGYPARPRREALRALAQGSRVPRLMDRLAALEARVGELERERRGEA